MEHKSKLQVTKEVLAEAQQKLTEDSVNWKDFLAHACRFYKYDFTNQLLIYTQKPNATACATFDQ